MYLFSSTKHVLILTATYSINGYNLYLRFNIKSSKINRRQNNKNSISKYMIFIL